MTKYKVDTADLENQATQLGAAGTALDGVASSLAGIRIDSSMHVAATMALRMQIRDCMQAVQNQRDNLNGLSAGLSSIAELYTNTEKDIVANANGEADGSRSDSAPPADPTEGMTYEEILKYREEHAVDKNTARLYEKYKKKIKIKDDDYDGTAHYNGRSNVINYDAQEDATNVRGAGCTYYHEVGHLMDDRSDWFGYTSVDGSYRFYDCLKKDMDAWLKRCMKENGYTDIADAYDDLEAWLWQDPNMKNGVSDIINGLSGGAACGGWAHDASYYNEESTAKEAFAHFFEAGMSHDPTKLNYIKEMFPSAYAEYQRMLADELD